MSWMIPEKNDCEIASNDWVDGKGGVSKVVSYARPEKPPEPQLRVVQEGSGFGWRGVVYTLTCLGCGAVVGAALLFLIGGFR